MIKKDKGLLEEAKNYLQDILNSDRKNQEAVVVWQKYIVKWEILIALVSKEGNKC